MVALWWAAAEDDPTCLDIAYRHVHDQLIAHEPVRHGPVRWATFRGELAEEKLRKAGVIETPDAQGLLEFIRATPGSVLVMGYVDVPAGGRA